MCDRYTDAVRCLCLLFIWRKIIITGCGGMCSMLSAYTHTVKHRIHRIYHCRRIFLIWLQKIAENINCAVGFHEISYTFEWHAEKIKNVQQISPAVQFCIHCSKWETRRMILFFLWVLSLRLACIRKKAYIGIQTISEPISRADSTPRHTKNTRNIQFDLFGRQLDAWWMCRCRHSPN